MKAEPTVQYHRALMKMPKTVHDVWQARVTDTYRFYFVIQGNTYILLDITKHPK